MAGRFLQVSAYKDLLSHSRFFLTLRSQGDRYHSLILFRLSSEKSAEELLTGKDVRPADPDDWQLYAMEASCPHLGADLSHAEIEQCDTGAVAVCPWHRYDFDLRTGKSETGLKACTYATQVRTDDEGVDNVWVETPDGGTNWRLVELRPVSEEFADPPPTTPDLSRLSLSAQGTGGDNFTRPEEVVPTEGAPSTLMQWAVLILNTKDPTMKVQRTKHAVHLFRKGQLKSIGHRSSTAPRPPDVPPRHDSYTNNLVDPRKAGKRKNKAMMLHALANVEQWAIDLAWDIIARFGPDHPELPPAFFSDFSKMALDESKHFSLLVARLAAISPSTPYGSLPVHAALWSSASVTFSSLRARLAIIHMVHEARGLDVNPGTIEKFRRAGDLESVKALEIIHQDEVTHVATGHRWFTWICAQQGVDPVQTFRQDVRRCWKAEVKGPFNVEARGIAGLTPDFYENLRGDLPND
ncbi:DUF455-domain-containing protein [Sparassis crispa]|uniref:DUF455-domain-containing protein n=1 Tax=Sparassis crispa TaxID=139825 RepID=A0A401GUD9_9APHY|nr:DUF455-domain-containing protein [Sparassis crispa]GBE85799.1 DUF455-domain-containing protein [Sparassis crispa]